MIEQNRSDHSEFPKISLQQRRLVARERVTRGVIDRAVEYLHRIDPDASAYLSRSSVEERDDIGDNSDLDLVIISHPCSGLDRYERVLEVVNRLALQLKESCAAEGNPIHPIFFTRNAMKPAIVHAAEAFEIDSLVLPIHFLYYPSSHSFSSREGFLSKNLLDGAQELVSPSYPVPALEHKLPLATHRGKDFVDLNKPDSWQGLCGLRGESFTSFLNPSDKKRREHSLLSTLREPFVWDIERAIAEFELNKGLLPDAYRAKLFATYVYSSVRGVCSGYQTDVDGFIEKFEQAGLVGLKEQFEAVRSIKIETSASKEFDDEQIVAAAKTLLYGYYGHMAQELVGESTAASKSELSPDWFMDFVNSDQDDPHKVVNGIGIEDTARAIDFVDPAVRRLAVVELASKDLPLHEKLEILQRGIRDSDALVRTLSLAELSALGPTAAALAPDIMQCFSDRSCAVRLWSVYAIGSLGPEGGIAAEQLGKDLGEYSSYDFAPLIVEALQNIKEEALPALPGILAHISRNHSFGGATLLRNLGPQILPQLTELVIEASRTIGKDLPHDYEDLDRLDRAPYNQRSCIASVFQSYEEDAIPFVMQIVKAKLSEYDSFPGSLASLFAPGIEQRIKAELSAADPETELHLLNAVSDMKTEVGHFEDRVRRSLYSQHPFVRMAACRALRTTGMSDTTYEALNELSVDPDREVQLEAAETIIQDKSRSNRDLNYLSSFFGKASRINQMQALRKLIRAAKEEPELWTLISQCLGTVHTDWISEAYDALCENCEESELLCQARHSIMDREKVSVNAEGYLYHDRVKAAFDFLKIDPNSSKAARVLVEACSGPQWDMCVVDSYVFKAVEFSDQILPAIIAAFQEEARNPSYPRAGHYIDWFQKLGEKASTALPLLTQFRDSMDDGYWRTRADKCIAAIAQKK